MAWIQGASLCQTVYECLVFHHPDFMGNRTSEIPHDVLRAYTLATAKCVDLAYQELSNGQMNDVEDCWMDHFGISVSLTDSVDDILGDLDRATSWMTINLANEWDRHVISRLEQRRVCD